MKRGFTLVELQVSLLLTVVLMSLLFLFTFYFWRNYHDHRDRLRFQRETETFIGWLNRHMRNAQSVEWLGSDLVFRTMRGEKKVLELGENGPGIHGAPFFAQPVGVEIRLQTSATGRELWLGLVGEGRQWSFRRSYPKLPSYELGRAEP